MAKSEGIEGLRVMITCRALAALVLHLDIQSQLEKNQTMGGLNSRRLCAGTLYSCLVVRMLACVAHGFPLCWDRPAALRLFLDCSCLSTLCPACRLCARQRQNLRSLPFGRNNDVQRDVRILMPQWANRNKVLLRKNFRAEVSRAIPTRS